MVCELYGWFERDSKGKISVDELKSILRSARRGYMKKHGAVPNLLTVRADEHQDWMDNMGIEVDRVESNLAPKHFTLTFLEGKDNE